MPRWLRLTASKFIAHGGRPRGSPPAAPLYRGAQRRLEGRVDRSRQQRVCPELPSSNSFRTRTLPLARYHTPHRTRSTSSRRRHASIDWESQGWRKKRAHRPQRDPEHDTSWQLYPTPTCSYAHTPASYIFLYYITYHTIYYLSPCLLTEQLTD